MKCFLDAIRTESVLSCIYVASEAASHHSVKGCTGVHRTVRPHVRCKIAKWRKNALVPFSSLLYSVSVQTAVGAARPIFGLFWQKSVENSYFRPAAGDTNGFFAIVWNSPLEVQARGG